MIWTSAQKRSVSVTMASSGVMSGIRAFWHSVPVTVAYSGVLFPRVNVHSFWIARFCPYRADALFRWGVTDMVRSMVMSSRGRIIGSLQRCNRVDWRRRLHVLQLLQLALMTYQPYRPRGEEMRRKSIRPCPLGVG